MLYKKDRFEVLTYQYINVKIGHRPTRDILYVQGKLLDKDTLHLFVNHWPSRRGGQAKSEPKRMMVATKLKSVTDSLNKTYKDPKIIIMGDLNDGTADKSVNEGLGAVSSLDQLAENGLFNTSYALQQNKKRGTHKYKAEWNLFDQMIVSTALLDKKSDVYLKPKDTYIFSPDWLQTEDDQFYGKKPFRTWAGPNYLGGFSDHFAVYVQLSIR